MKYFWQYAVLGLNSGGAYAIIALGLVSVYRGSGVVNFAQGAIGMAGTYAFWKAYSSAGIPLVPSVLLGVACGVLIGFLSYAVVMRKLSQAAEVTKLIATLGILEVLEGLAAAIFGSTTTPVGNIFGSGRLRFFGASLTPATLATLIVTLLAALGLAVAFRWTSLGVRSSALRDNERAAKAIGISPRPVGSVTWAVGGGLGALAGILLLPITGLSPTQLTALVIPALAIGLLARFQNLGLAVLYGLALGVAQAELLKYNVNAGIIRSVPFAVIVVALLVTGRSVPGRGTLERFRLPAVGDGRLKPRHLAVVCAVGIGIALLSPTWAQATINSAVAMLICLSVVVVTGYAGQVSLAPMALAGVSALVAATAGTDWGLSFVPSVLVGVAVAIVVGVVIGLPAVRIRGIGVAIATIGLSLVIEDAIFGDPRLTGGVTGLTVQRPSLGGFDINAGLHPGRYAVVCLVVVAGVGLMIANVRRSRSGLRYLALRANERGAAALGVSVTGAKLGAFGVSAAIAGLAGALFTYQFSIVPFDSFTFFNSITLVSLTLLGGVGFVVGGIIGGLIATGGLLAYFVTSQLHVGSFDKWLPVLSGIALIDVMVRHPDGLVRMSATVDRHLEHLIERVAQLRTREDQAATGAQLASGRTGADTMSRAVEPASTGLGGHPQVEQPGQRSSGLLELSGVTVRYGGTVAVSNVDLTVRSGTVLGVIGPNGAGKTTLIDAITGFAKVTSGSVTLNGAELTAMAPHRRCRLGIGRTFQNLELFEDLTVRENLLCALDGQDVGAYVTTLLWSGRRELPADTTAVASQLGLELDLDVAVGNLPQGKRRMVAVARMLARRPQVICLDEPGAGLNGPERQQLGDLMRSLAAQLPAGVLLVEHNVDLVAASCHEVLALNFGEIIAQGPAEQVLTSEAVRSAYLGAKTGTQLKIETSLGTPMPEAHTR